MMKSMIVTLSGDNEFGLSRELRVRIDAFVTRHTDVGLERIDGEEAGFDRMREALQSPPFLTDKKLVVLRTPGANKEFIGRAELLFDGLPDTTEVIIVEPKPDKRSAYYRTLRSKTEFLTFETDKTNSLPDWVVAVVKEQGGAISLTDAHYLIDRVGQSQQIVSSELAKLILYDNHITRTTINLLTEATPQSTIFQLLEAAFNGNARRALELYDEQRAMNVEPPVIVSMLTWQLHILAIIKAAGGKGAEVIAEDARLKPYAVRKSRTIASGISVTRLRELMAQLLGIDRRSKKENIDSDEALRNFLLAIAYDRSA